MADDKHPTQAIPDDGRKGAPDGVNTQGQTRATGGSDAGAPYPNPHTGKQQSGGKSRLGGFMGHGGQSDMAYHGTGQLGDEETGSRRGGNPNSASQEE